MAHQVKLREGAQVFKLSRFFIWQLNGETKWVITEFDPKHGYCLGRMRWYTRYDTRADAELRAIEMCED